jgi:hypothetical protein
VTYTFTLQVLCDEQTRDFNPELYMERLYHAAHLAAVMTSCGRIPRVMVTSQAAGAAEEAAKPEKGGQP